MFISESNKKETDIFTMDDINLELYDHNIWLFSNLLPCVLLATRLKIHKLCTGSHCHLNICYLSIFSHFHFLQLFAVVYMFSFDIYGQRLVQLYYNVVKQVIKWQLVGCQPSIFLVDVVLGTHYN